MDFLKRNKERMKTLALCFSKTRGTDRNADREGETSGGGEDSPAAQMETIAGGDDRATPSGEGERGMELRENPPSDDVCPICFGNFDVPCRAPCGHWYCGACILQYWNFSAVVRPCRCPMCLQPITKLTPEASYYGRSEAEICKVLRSVGDYNRLFVGGINGFMLKFLAIPLYTKRVFREMLNPDRPALHLHEMRLIACFCGLVYTLMPFDFLQIGHRNVVEVFDYVAFGLTFIMYLVGLYLRWRRQRNVRELMAIQEE